MPQNSSVVSGSVFEVMLLQWVSLFCTSLFHDALSNAVLTDCFLFSSSFPDWNFNVSLDAEASAPVGTDLQLRSAPTVTGDLKKFTLRVLF